MEKGVLVGQGKTAEVYEWGPDRVLKLYFEQFGDDRVKNEARIGNVVHKSGVPSPCVFDIIESDGRKGIVFQRISGKTILKHIEEEPWMACFYAKQMARFHYNIHKHFTSRLPPQKERFALKIGRFSEIFDEKGKRILDYMKSLPDGNRICHGDLHLKNIIISNKGLVAVDWNSACKGNPLGDVARTCLMINSARGYSGISDMITTLSDYSKRLIYWTYLNEYMKLARVRFDDIDAWTLPVAAARLKDKAPGENKWLMEIIDKQIKKHDI